PTTSAKTRPRIVRVPRAGWMEVVAVAVAGVTSSALVGDVAVMTGGAMIIGWWPHDRQLDTNLSVALPPAADAPSQTAMGTSSKPNNRALFKAKPLRMSSAKMKSTSS